jgi:hypothetical protein
MAVPDEQWLRAAAFSGYGPQMQRQGLETRDGAILINLSDARVTDFEGEVLSVYPEGDDEVVEQMDAVIVIGIDPRWDESAKRVGKPRLYLTPTGLLQSNRLVENLVFQGRRVLSSKPRPSSPPNIR